MQWNNFQEKMNSAFGMLRNDQNFADVTLACEGDTQIEAHKVILASFSPFFMEVSKKNTHPHPIIYMRGLKERIDWTFFLPKQPFARSGTHCTKGDRVSS